MDRSETRYDVHDGFGALTLARPEIRNALTGRQILDEIITTVESADGDEEVAVLVITGEGSAFSAGGNVKDMDSASGLFAGDVGTIAEGYRRTIQRLTSVMAETDLVTIAAVNGPAVGAGFDLALGCDLRIGSTKARFAHTFADLGILPGDGGAWLLPRVVGWQRAAELSFTARMIDAEEARALDVLLEVVEPDRLMDRAFELATTIASKPSHSIRLTKRLLRHAKHMDLPEFLDLTAAYQAIAHADPQHRTAVSTFLEALRGQPSD
jgi:enoyl-CoA hydratase/carnithine racemase